MSHCVYIPPFISHVLTGIWIVSKFLYSSGLLNISDRNIHIRACILAFFTLMWIPRVEDCVIYRCLCKFLRNSQLFSKGYIILCTPPPRGGGLWGPVTSFVGTWYSQFFHIWAVSIAGWWGCVLRFVSLVIGHWGSPPVLCWFLSFLDEVFAQIFHSFWCWVGCCFAERCLVCCRFKVPDTIGRQTFSVCGLASQFLSVLWKNTNFNFDWVHFI